MPIIKAPLFYAYYLRKKKESRYDTDFENLYKYVTKLLVLSMKFTYYLFLFVTLTLDDLKVTSSQPKFISQMQNKLTRDMMLSSHLTKYTKLSLKIILISFYK